MLLKKIKVFLALITASSDNASFSTNSKGCTTPFNFSNLLNEGNNVVSSDGDK